MTVFLFLYECVGMEIAMLGTEEKYAFLAHSLVVSQARVHGAWAGTEVLTPSSFCKL